MKIPEEKKKILISYNIEKAENAMDDAQFLIENKKLYSAYNRIYYACFYILSALSMKNDFYTSKHKQLIGWFNKNYVNENIVDKKLGKILNKAFDQRIESDYGMMSEPSYADIVLLSTEAKEFIEEVKKLIYITQN